MVEQWESRYREACLWWVDPQCVMTEEASAEVPWDLDEISAVMDRIAKGEEDSADHEVVSEVVDVADDNQLHLKKTWMLNWTAWLNRARKDEEENFLRQHQKTTKELHDWFWSSSINSIWKVASLIWLCVFTCCVCSCRCSIRVWYL